MIIKCKKCGNEYELKSDKKLSEFKCECGGELSPKMQSENPKSHGTLKKSNHNDHVNITSKYKKIGVVMACAVGLVFVMVFSGMLFSDNTISGDTVTSISNSTYSGNGLTFNYPAGWKSISNLTSPSRWGYGNPLVAFYQPIGNGSPQYIETYFYVKQKNVGSLDEMLSNYRSDIASIGQTEISERNITVNGMKAVELFKTWSAGGKKYKAMTVHIEAVKGSKYYRIGCVVPASEYNATLPKFEMVVNSFKRT
jgi:hypothetical protein